MAATAVAVAGALAATSRTSADVRQAQDTSGATDPSLGASFTDGQVSRHAAYRRATYLFFALSVLLEVTVLVLLARGPFRGFVDAVQRIPGGWPVHACVLGAATAAILSLAALPLVYVRGFAIEHAWGLSTQDFGGWLADRGRATTITAVTGAIAAVAFFGIVRWQPRFWWLLGWATFSILTFAFAFLWPVLVAPLFNKFTPLDDAQLKERVLSLASRAGVDVDEVLVVDASRRTTLENAYVAGLGATKRVVVYDTLLEAGNDDETAFVVAHELGHRSRGHVWKSVALASVGLLAGFAVLWWLSRQDSMWSWAGAAGIGDLRSLPILLLIGAVAALVAAPVENSFSRRFESEADDVAIELTQDPATAVRVFRRLAFANVADLDPPTPLVWMLYSHPPIAERIEAVLATRGPTEAARSEP